MAGSAIVRALKRSGYGDHAKRRRITNPKPSGADLLDESAVRNWMSKHKPDVVVLAAATVGGIEANRSTTSRFPS